LVTKPISELWHEAARKWVELEAAANLYEESKSSVLAQLMSKCGDMPVSRAEMTVKASDGWKEHIERIAKAREAANLAKVEVDYLRMRHSEAMSKEATDRLEAKL
jgi:hypothetical protein